MKRYFGYNISDYKEGERSIVGTLTPVEWDSFLNVSQYAIYTRNDEEIIIESIKYHSRLVNLINKEVIVFGYTRTNKNGDRFLKLRKIKELNDSLMLSAETS